MHSATFRHMIVDEKEENNKRGVASIRVGNISILELFAPRGGTEFLNNRFFPITSQFEDVVSQCYRPKGIGKARQSLSRSLSEQRV